MPDNIEEQIFKLSIDGSGYIQGADQLAASTKKLSTEQEKNNKIVAELKKSNLQLAQETKTLSSEYNKNAKELREVLALQKESVAGTKAYTSTIKILGDEQKRLSAAIISNKSVLAQNTVEIKNIEKATGGFTKSLSGAYTGLSKIAQIIPGLGIGGLIGLIAGPLISGLSNWISSLGGVNNAMKQAARESQLLSEIQKEVASSAGKEIAQLEVLYKVATNTTLSIKERQKAVDELQKQYPDYFKNIKDEIILQGGAKDAYLATRLAILANAQARAIENKVAEAANRGLELEIEKKKLIEKQEKANADLRKANASTKDKEARGLDQFTAISQGTELRALQAENQEAIAANIAETEFLLNLVKTAPTSTPFGKPDKAKKEAKEIQNVFLKEQADLNEKLAAANRKFQEDELTIRREFAQKLAEEQLRIEQLVKDKKLRPGGVNDPNSEAGQLFGIATNTNAVLLQKALDDLRKKTIAAREKLNAELISLQDKNMQDQLNLIQEEFERRSKLIDFNEQKELANSKAATDKRLAALDLERLLIGEKAYQDGKAILISAGEQAALNIIQKFANQRKDLSSDIFQSLLQQYDNAIKGADLIRDEQTAKDVTALAEKLNAGKISYEKFQKEIKRIQKQADLDSKIGSLQVDKDKLQALDNQLAAIEDKYSESYKKLKKQRDEQASKVAKEEIALAKDQDKPEADPRFARIAKYAESIGSVIQAVINFWEKANEAESKALDRSISLQEKRVEAAQRIAARGNAQYLKQEEDRLKELTIKRENAARRELGINAALQASQLLVGITGAIAKIATPGIGIAETIGAIAVIFGALATGYGLVKSLQGNQPKLAGGSKYVTRDGNPAGVDTIPALINEGEAVIPTDTNKAYHPAIAAIYDKSIPAEHLNSFVNNYHKIKSVPSPNYDRLRETAEISIGENGRMSLLLSDNNRKLDESNDIGRQTLKILHKLGVNVSLDQNGFAVTQMEVIEQMRKNKRL